MQLLATTKIALRALAKNKLRASLTVLGIVIGVAAVTALVSVGQSASASLQGELQGLGTNVILVIPASKEEGGVRGGRGASSSLTAEDAEALGKQCPSLLAVTAVVGTPANVIYGNSNWTTREVLGVTKDYLMVRNWEVRLGGFFTERDVASSAKVCVLGQTLVEKLFQTTSPLGKSVRINKIPFEVIGVLESKGANIGGQDQDDIILAPLTTVRSRLKGASSDKVDVIFCSARSQDEEKMSEAQHEIRTLMNERHKVRSGDAADFEVKNTAEIARLLSVIAGTMTALLASIAAVALLVGGVGIMNIMLVSVTERTREIGVRMAVGARQRDILWQFLHEAVILAILGGLVGLALGTAASVGLILLINACKDGAPLPVVISLPAAALAISFAAAIGVFFGYYPARRASQLDPIEALRYE